MGESLGLSAGVRDYVQRYGAREHPALARCRRDTAAMANASMQISPEQGAFMQTLARAIHARRALEVGVFTGYSSTAVALALNDMHGTDACLVACDLSADYLERARGYWREAGVDRIVLSRAGPALQTLHHLIDEGMEGSFDLAFIDADKTGYDAYYECALRLLRVGGVVLLDNMLREGGVADARDQSEATRAIRALAAKIHDDRRVDMCLTAIGDGLSMAVKF